MLLRYYDDVVALHPDAVIIVGGTNDLAHGIRPEITRDNLTFMCAIARRRKIAVMLGTIPPLSRFEAQIRQHNNWVRSHCENDCCKALDFSKVLGGSDGTFVTLNSREGVHPNDHGYDAMTKLVISEMGI